MYVIPMEHREELCNWLREECEEEISDFNKDIRNGKICWYPDRKREMIKMRYEYQIQNMMKYGDYRIKDREPYAVMWCPRCKSLRIKYDFTGSSLGHSYEYEISECMDCGYQARNIVDIYKSCNKDPFKQYHTKGHVYYEVEQPPKRRGWFNW